MLFRKKDPASADAPSRRRRFAKPAAAALVLVLVAGSLVAFRVSSARKDEPAKAASATVLEFTPADVAVVELRNLARTIPISGSLSPVAQSTVRSKVPGEVRRVHVREGEKVAQGQLLAEIDTADLQARLDAQVAALEESKARLSIAAKNRDNAHAAAHAGVHLPERVRHHAELLRGGRSRREIRRGAGAPRPQRDERRASCARPSTGIVATRMVNPGEQRRASTARSSRSSTWPGWRSRRPCPPRRSRACGVGQAATLRVDGFGERVFAGQLERINPTTEQASRAITVYLSVSNRDGALRGGHVRQGQPRPRRGRDRARRSRRRPCARKRARAFVFTIEKGKIGRRAVALGRREEEAGLVQVRSGLDAGETVVQLARDGAQGRDARGPQGRRRARGQGGLGRAPPCGSPRPASTSPSSPPW